MLVSGLAQADTVFSITADGNAETVAAMDALTKAYTAAHPDITIEIENRPGGADGDNFVKTRLATGEAADILQYNSGSLVQALKPVNNLADFSDISCQANVNDSFKSVVTASDGAIRGVPFGPAMGGGIYYNKKIYADLGLSVPKTWAEFMANNAKIKAAGKVAVAKTYGDTWTSQLFVLADYYYVQAAVPAFAANYTANKAKYATTPSAMAGFQHLEDVFKGIYLNEDFGVAKFDDAVRMVATGQAAHYPMLTFALGNIKQSFPDNLNDVGFFAQPGDDASKHCLTVWMPAGLYILAASTHVAEAKGFLSFVASVEGCNLIIGANGATGPYLIKGCDLPADVPGAVADMMPFFTAAGPTAPALEFLSPIKGPALEQITVEVGSGIRPASEAAGLLIRTLKSGPNTSVCPTGNLPVTNSPPNLGRGFSVQTAFSRQAHVQSSDPLTLLVRPARRGGLCDPVFGADPGKLLVQHDTVGPFYRRIHRLGQLPSVFQGTVSGAGPCQPPCLRCSDLGHENRLRSVAGRAFDERHSVARLPAFGHVFSGSCVDHRRWHHRSGADAPHQGRHQPGACNDRHLGPLLAV